MAGPDDGLSAFIYKDGQVAVRLGMARHSRGG